jgi:hypothetical protein
MNVSRLILVTFCERPKNAAGNFLSSVKTGESVAALSYGMKIAHLADVVMPRRQFKPTLRRRMLKCFSVVLYDALRNFSGKSFQNRNEAPSWGLWL